MSKTVADLSTTQKGKYNKLGATAQSLVDFDSAVNGTGIIDDPSLRVMTGCLSAAQATEQAAAITAAGGMAALAGKTIGETGKQLGK